MFKRTVATPTTYLPKREFAAPGASSQDYQYFRSSLTMGSVVGPQTVLNLRPCSPSARRTAMIFLGVQDMTRLARNLGTQTEVFNTVHNLGIRLVSASEPP